MNSTRHAARISGELLAERIRQVEEEGFDTDHDAMHDIGELAGAAACYAAGDVNLYARDCLGQEVPIWSFDLLWWKPKDRRRDLIRAGALIMAEIEILDREGEAPADLSSLISNGAGNVLEKAELVADPGALTPGKFWEALEISWQYPPPVRDMARAVWGDRTADEFPSPDLWRSILDRCAECYVGATLDAGASKKAAE